MGFELIPCPNLNGVWMNIEESPFICIAHRLRIWNITVSFGGHKFEAEGPTEAKARINFASKLTLLRDAIGTIETWAKRR